MALTPGTCLGVYEIIAPIGEGGMGQVFRARDTKLDRDVAIKILPEAFADDADRLARFTREAKTLASLNHPNIAHIHGLEESGGVRALVMELVEGEDLTQRIARGAMPLDEMLPIARQIAEALEAAHEQGIIHRDLKPANIRLRPDGKVKVLDFGLAKALEAPASIADMSQSPTQSGAATRAGVVLGTAGYMAPEQVKGKPVDRRTDIWAFGCVLYEMLTGRRAFVGQTLAETIAAVLEREPDWHSLPRDTPAAVRRVLRRCLEKEPKRRLRDVADAQMEIDDPVADAVREAPPRAAVDHRRRRVWVAASVLTAVVATLFVAEWATRDATTIQPITRTAILFPTDQELERNAGAHPITFSPDGTRLIYVASQGALAHLFVRELDELVPKRIPGTDGARQPFFSRDGKWVGFFAGSLLKRVALDGGLPLQVGGVSGSTRGGSWAADGTIVFAIDQSGLFKVSATGGEPEAIPDSEGAAWPEILPDGRVLFTAGGSAFVAMALDGSEKRVLARRSDVPGDGQPLLGTAWLLQGHYVSTRHLVYGQSPGVVNAIAFDLGASRFTGSPISLIGAVFEAPGAGAVYFTVSERGLLAYAPENRDRQLTWVDRAGAETPLGIDPQSFRFPQLSPDGKHLAVSIDDDTRRSDIWIYEIESGNRIRLTSAGHNLNPAWTPDGVRIAYNNNAGVVWQPINGQGPSEILLRGPYSARSWSLDGELLVRGNDPTQADLFVLPRNMIDKPSPLLVTPFNETEAEFSPNGRLVAFVSDESGRPDLFVMRYPERHPKIPVSTAGGTSPIWSADGRELFYRQNLTMMSVGIDITHGLQVGATRRLFPASSYVGAGGDLSFDVAPDGLRFLMTKETDPSVSRQLVVVHNWTEELKRLVPTK